MSNSTVQGYESPVPDYSGGIYNSGTMTVSNSTLWGNAAYRNAVGHGGGAIHNAGTLTVMSSTISGSKTLWRPAAGRISLNTLAARSLTISDSIVSGNAGGDCSGSGCPANGTDGNVVGVGTVNLSTPGRPWRANANDD